MQEQQQNTDNMIAITEKYQSIDENIKLIENETTMNSGICYINNNFIDIKKTSPLSMPSGIIIMQPNQNLNQQQQIDEHTSKNTKDLLLNTINYNSQSINNNLNSHNNNIKLNTIQENDNDKSAFNCNKNSDNNLNITKSLNHSINEQQQQNGCNTKLNLINKIDKIQSPITSLQITTTTTSPTTLIINKNIEIDHENAYNHRSYVEDVHNYSKKSNGYMELSSNCSNNTSSGTDDFDSDDFYQNEFYMNKIHRNYNKKFDNNCINETDTNTNNKKCIKFIKNRNDNNKKILKRKINQNHINNYDNDKKLLKSKTPDSGVPDDDEKLLTPDHHARRPMNAFLIFCKRHRAIVREKYKNVENRQITKILGEWWANMTEDEKSCYANLAKENKDQFLSANPNFKWYKLPAPPLRTLTTRPLNNTAELSLIKKDEEKNHLNNESDLNEHINIKNHNNNNNTSSLILNHQQQQHHKKLASPTTTTTSSQVGVFKFADETQMGSLNNLICGDDNINNSPTNSMKSSSLSPNNDNNELQNALCETSDYLCNTITNKNFPISHHEPFENMRDHAKKMKMSKLNYNYYSKLSINVDNDKKIIRDNSFSSSEDDGNLINRKLSRTCKGKKYQELINSGQISVLNKKIKKSNNYDQSNCNDNTNNNNYLKDSSSDSDYYNQISPKSQIDYQQQQQNLTNEYNNNNYLLNCKKNQLNNKATKKQKQQFDLIDFDLDSKIMALPAQCLDQYLLKKQESKSKKKINSKRRKTIGNRKQFNNTIGKQQQHQPEPEPIKTNNDELKEQIVGSQKRKARKESITRRDINSIQNETKLLNYVEFNGGGTIPSGNNDDDFGCPSSACIEIKEENLLEIDTIITPDESTKQEQNFRATDLLILAEVASNVDE